MRFDKFYISLYKKHYKTTFTKEQNMYMAVCDVIEDFIRSNKEFSAYDVKVEAAKLEPSVSFTLYGVKKIVKYLYKDKAPIFEGYKTKIKKLNKNDKTVRAIFYYPVDKAKIEWIDGPEPDKEEKPFGDCDCAFCKENNAIKVKFDVEDPDVLVDAFKKVSSKLEPNNVNSKDPTNLSDLLPLMESLKSQVNDFNNKCSKMKPLVSLHTYDQVKVVLVKLVEEKKNFSACELKKEVLKTNPGLKLTTKAVRKVLDQIFWTSGEVLSSYNRSPQYVVKGSKRVNVLFYYPGVRDKKLGMNYIVPTTDSTVSGDNLQNLLSSTKVVWVLAVILKVFEVKETFQSKLDQVKYKIKGFYS